jgi:hypothetical protein
MGGAAFVNLPEPIQRVVIMHFLYLAYYPFRLLSREISVACGGVTI